MGVNYNQSRRTAKSDGAKRNSSDWSLLLDVSARLGKGWSVGVDSSYQSSVATFFTRFDEHWVLNAHCRKEFKRFNVFFDVTDLLDHARQTTFESADGKQLWVDVTRENRRLFLLGIQ